MLFEKLPVTLTSLGYTHLAPISDAIRRIERERRLGYLFCKEYTITSSVNETIFSVIFYDDDGNVLFFGLFNDALFAVTA